MSKIEDIQQNLFLLWEDIAEARGFDRVVGTVICTLLTENRPLSQMEIAEKTGYSVPTISKTLKTLVSLGSVRKMKKRGERIFLYYTAMHPLEMLSGALTKWIVTAKSMKNRISKMYQELVEIESKHPEQAIKLMNTLRDFSESVPKMIDIMEKAIEDIQKIR
jgi:DNA-binding transcriptional regulator GbsR (MarR family)